MYQPIDPSHPGFFRVEKNRMSDKQRRDRIRLIEMMVRRGYTIDEMAVALDQTRQSLWEFMKRWEVITPTDVKNARKPLLPRIKA